MRKNLLILVVLVIGLLLPPAATARQDTLVIWHALAPEDTRVVANLGDAFARETGEFWDVRYADAQRLFENAMAARGIGPDIIIANNEVIEPLIDEGYVRPLTMSQPFFLDNLLARLPAMVNERCGNDSDIAACLWPRVSPTLPLDRLDENSIERAAGWMCEAAPWLAFCGKESLMGVPVSWWFNLYLIDGAWLDDRGVDLPYEIADLSGLRNEYGLDFVWASQNSIPLAEEADFPAVFAIPSGLIATDPNGVMRSMGSFYDAGYLPVLEIHVDSIYITADADDPAQAETFAEFALTQPQILEGFVQSSNRLPAFGPDVMRERGLDSPASMALLRALVTLVAYGDTTF